jgi:transposase
MILGIDLGKHRIHVIGINKGSGRSSARNAIACNYRNRQLRRGACRVLMESCSRSQSSGRRFAARGHDVRLIPAQFVNPYVKANKNDLNDAVLSRQHVERESHWFR